MQVILKNGKIVDNVVSTIIDGVTLLVERSNDLGQVSFNLGEIKEIRRDDAPVPDGMLWTILDVNDF